MTDLSNSDMEGRAPRAATSNPRRRQSLAVTLLDQVLAGSESSTRLVAAALMVHEATIDEYRTGRLPIPIEAQMLLAAFTIERVPQYARLGYRLRGQIRARIAFAAGETETHAGLRPSSRW